MIDLRFGTLRVFPAGYDFCSGSFASAVICAVYTIGCNGKIAFRLISAAHRRPPPRTNARTDGRLVSAYPVILISDTVSLRPCAFGARAHTRRTLRAAACPLDSAFLHPLSAPLRLTAAHRSARMRADGRLRFSLPFPLSYRFPLTVCPSSVITPCLSSQKISAPRYR